VTFQLSPNITDSGYSRHNAFAEDFNRVRLVGQGRIMSLEEFFGRGTAPKRRGITP